MSPKSSRAFPNDDRPESEGESGRLPRPRPDHGSRIPRRQAARRPRRRRDQDRAARGGSGAPPGAFCRRRRRRRALAPLAVAQHQQEGDRPRLGRRGRARGVSAPLSRRRRGHRVVRSGLARGARPRLGHPGRGESGPRPLPHQPFRPGGSEGAPSRHRPRRRRQRRQHVPHGEFGSGPGALYAADLVLPRRHRGGGGRRLCPLGSRVAGRRSGRRRVSARGHVDAQHDDAGAVSPDRLQGWSHRRRLPRRQGALPRAVAVPGRLGLLRPAERAGAPTRNHRPGELHGRARHGPSMPEGTRLEDIQPQRDRAGRGR